MGGRRRRPPGQKLAEKALLLPAARFARFGQSSACAHSLRSFAQ
ncbi:uncharacterized protein HHUB_3419 [Halobacterium hubeiense]|uniref:Uncharacterized protein n=1 Tax=Halobacterium hubeiense TaxID=1407499 RepID=A0A0U5H3A3_9EURY|nr:uncharacterized protein HHUB_3419 [Halobacterium hubeiense]